MNIQQGAEEIVAHNQAVYTESQDYVSVSPGDYPHLDQSFYDEVRDELAAQGFVFLDDCENRTLAAAPGNVLMPVMIRVLAAGDGSITAGIYHARVKPLWLRLLMVALRKRVGRTIDFETEFADGSFLCTSNAIAAAAMSLPPTIACEYLPADTRVARLLARHRERVAEKQAQTGLAIAPARTLREVRAAQNRMNAIKAAYRREVGAVTKEELAKLSFPGTRGISDEVHAEIQKLQAAAASPPKPEGSASSTFVTSDASALPPALPSETAALSPGLPPPPPAPPPPPPVDPRDAGLLAAVQARGERGGGKNSNGVWLLLTAILFLGVGGFQWGWLTVVHLAVAIGLHEIGHVLAMRCFGYKNVRMLFVPFFGGLATGEPRELDATKNALVALAGPAFGLCTVVGAGIAARWLDSPPWLVNFAWVSLLLNAFNLLPIVPLDGGQFANDALFSRVPILELIFRLLAIAALGWLAFADGSWVLGVLAFFMLFSTQLAFRRACLIRDARRDPRWQIRPLDVGAVVALRELVAKLYAGLAREKYEAKLPEHVHGFWLEIRKRFPGPGTTAGLLVGYFVLALVLFPIVAVLLSALVGSPSFSGVPPA